MPQIIILGVSIIVLGILYLLYKKKDLKIEVILKVLAVLLFTSYVIGLNFENALDDVFNVLLVDVKSTEPAYAPDTWIFSPGMTVFIHILRWLTTILIAMSVISSFIKSKHAKFLSTFLGPVLIVLNLIFLDQHLIAVYGEVNYLKYRSILIMIQIMITIVIVTINWFNLIKDKLWPNKKEVRDTILLFLGSLIFLMPLGFIYNLFGKYGEVAENFNKVHLFLISLYIALIFVIYFALKKRTFETRKMFLTYMVIAGVFQYFYLERRGYGGLPLHLCNTAVILLFIAYVFNSRRVFYFTYFANVLGAFVAIMLPNYSSDVFSIGVMHFSYSHFLVFVIPILSVALKIFEKPKLKDMRKAIGIFTLYYILVVFLNAWFNNYESVDYFFTYGFDITKRFNLQWLQTDYVASFTYKGLTFKFFYVYQILLYLGFVFLMFMSWYVYDLVYQAIDNQAALIKKQKEKRIEMNKLKEALGSKNLSDPIKPEYQDKVVIEHFTKRYGSSKKKAVDDFSLTIETGYVYGFLGHNGAGKSTTIKSLVGIQSITEGEMYVCGYSIKSQPMEAKLRIGYVSDNHAVYERLTGREYINYVADLYRVDPKDRDQRLEEYLEKFQLGFAIDREVKSYSHGMKQKLVVIASLIHNPKVWILDEPLTGLDPASSFQIKQMMKEHADNGNIVFFSTHIIEVVEKLCDRICIINQGKLIGDFAVKDIMKEGADLEKLYLTNHEQLEAAAKSQEKLAKKAEIKLQKEAKKKAKKEKKDA